MKHNFFLKAAFTFIMCGSISLASAADIYVSNGAGDDTKDGLSAANAVKTISKAFTISLVGDVIHIMDMISLSNEPTKTGARGDIDIAGLTSTKTYTVNGVTYSTWNVGGNLGIIPHTRSVTIVGDDKASCGFDGNGTSCLIRQDLSALGANNGGTGVAGITEITYKNLTFKNGKSNDASGGGGIYVRGGFPVLFTKAKFENCEFITNTGNQGTTMKTGGGLFMKHGALELKKCRFAENMATKGGAMYIEGGDVLIDSCVIENNDLSAVANSNGAAILAVLPSAGIILNMDVKNTLFKNNKVASYGGAISTYETNAISSGTLNMKYTNCAFVENNSGTGLGGAIYVNNSLAGTTSNTTANVSFINTTFYNNVAGAASGGAIGVYSLLANSKFDMINCTVSGNKVSGTTGAAGAGVRFLKGSSAGIRTIKNSILENNTAVDANMANAADYADLGMEANVDPVTFVETRSYEPGTTLIIEKSLIGSCKNTDFDTQFPLNKTNYAFELNGSIVNSFKAKLGAFDEEKNYFPLQATSEAIGYGLTSYLTSLNPSILTDQIMRYRPATACSAGAYEFETVTTPPPAGLKNVQKGSLVVYRNANNQLVVNNTTANAGIITVCNMMGQVVATAQMTGTVTTINKAIKAGAYVVMLSSNGKVSTQKVILN